MKVLLSKAENAIKAGAATVGATAETVVRGGVPGAEYHPEIIELAKDAFGKYWASRLGWIRL